MSKFKKHIIITGSARSGTSWLCENMAQAFRYRLLFEPDHAINVPRAKVLGDTLFNVDTNNESANNYLNKVFKNRIESDWIGQSSNRKFKMHLWPFIPKKYIIKFVRSNLAAKYMNSKYGIPVIFIIRNPYDVIGSQNRVKFPWLYDLTKFKSQDDLVHLIKDISGLNIKKEVFNAIEILTIRWCIENVIPLKHQPNF